MVHLSRLRFLTLCPYESILSVRSQTPFTTVFALYAAIEPSFFSRLEDISPYDIYFTQGCETQFQIYHSRETSVGRVFGG